MQRNRSRVFISLVCLALFMLLALGSSSSENREYVDEMMVNYTAFNISLERLGNLFLSDEQGDGWNAQVQTEINLIKKYADEAQRVIPSEDYIIAHEHYLLATETIDEAMDWLSAGIEEDDFEKIFAGQKILLEGKSYLKDAAYEIERW